MPSLYESTPNTGEVSSSNFTTLYNASGLAVPNAGAGSITGNLNVGGNLTVQGSSLLIGEVILQSTLSLPNYTFPNPDGATDMVMVTDGSGNITWKYVQSLPGAEYNISATTVTGGANLTLANTAGDTDSVKFASGTGISVSRTDANTITVTNTAPDTNTTYTIDASTTTGGANLNLVGSDSTTDTVKFAGTGSVTVSRTDANTITINSLADNIPDGTAKGQVLYWDGSAWTASTNITSAASANRLTLQYDNSGAGPNAVLFLKKNYGATAYTTNDGVGQAFLLDSDTQTLNQIATINAIWKGSPSATEITLNSNTLDNTVGPFTPTATFSVAQATLPGVLAVNGETITVNADSTNADSFLYFKDATNTEYLKWNKTDTRFEFSDQLYITQTEVPAVFERRVTTAEVNPSEAKGAVKLLQRVTDAASNATDDSGPAVVFGRTSGATASAEQIFSGMGSVWYGTTTKAALQFNWSPDNYPEPTPGVFPTTYTLLRLNSDYAQFFNDSLYVDYAYVDSTKTATSITGGNTLVFGSAHGYTAGTRILYQTATANGLTQSTYYYVLATGLTSTQCQVSTISGGTAAVLTNGTGLTLTFASVSNRIGINTDTPSEVLDVNGNANVSGVVTVQGDAVTINSDKTDTDTYLNFGRVAPANNAAIRWNAATDSFEWSADSTTWYDFIDVVLTTPQEGQSIIYNGTNWENSNEFEFTNFAYRSSFINNVSAAGSIVSAEFLKRRTGSLVNGNSSGQLLGQVIGTTETYTHRLVSQYESTGNNEYLIQVDPIGNFNPATTTITTQLAVDNDSLRLSATDITLNINGTVSAGVDAGLTIERGTSGADATFKWIESNTRFEANASIYSLGNLIADGPNIQVNADATAADSFLYMKGTAEYLKWDDTNTRFEFSDDLEVVGNVNATSYNIDDTRARIDTGNSAAWSAGANIALTTTDKNVQKAIFYITDGTDVQTLEALALRTGTGAGDAMLTTYGEMYSSTPLAEFTAEISAGALRIRGTNLTATTLTVSILSSTLL